MAIHSSTAVYVLVIKLLPPEIDREDNTFNNKTVKLGWDAMTVSSLTAKQVSINHMQVEAVKQWLIILKEDW